MPNPDFTGTVPTRRCETCKYWNKMTVGDVDSGFGACHRLHQASSGKVVVGFKWPAKYGALTVPVRNVGQGSSGSPVDPASGALVEAVDPRPEVTRALERAAHRIKRRLYFALARLYFLKFRLELASAALRVKRKAFRLGSQYVDRIRHRRPL